jgi:hypothetical protein
MRPGSPADAPAAGAATAGRAAAEPTRAAAAEPERQRPTTVTAQERRRMIEHAAYMRALARGFRGDRAEQDWYEAEAEIDALLMGRGTRS